MNFGQLDHYINDLRQSGFDTMRLRVELWHKLAYPLMAVIMAVLAIPFRALHGPPQLTHRHCDGHRRHARLHCDRQLLRARWAT
jgi:hypothetical protein